MALNNRFNPTFDNSAFFQNSASLQFATSVPSRPSAPANSFPPAGYQANGMVSPMQYPATYNNRFNDSESSHSSSPNHAIRSVHTKAERRAEHNATERARRESLNVKFQQLANLLPNLMNDTRPSKSTIIERTLDFVSEALAKEAKNQQHVKHLTKINSYLLSQLDDREHGLSRRCIEEDHDNAPVTAVPDYSPMVSSRSPIRESYMRKQKPEMQKELCEGQETAEDTVNLDRSPTFSLSNSHLMMNSCSVSPESVNTLPRDALYLDNNLHHWSAMNNNAYNMIPKMPLTMTPIPIKEELVYNPYENNQSTMFNQFQRQSIPLSHHHYMEKEYPFMSNLSYNQSHASPNMEVQFNMTSDPYQ